MEIGAKPGELGQVLVTDLLNLAMPLIRYRIGDMAIYDETPCKCGRSLPRLKKVAGRVTDFLVGRRREISVGGIPCNICRRQTPFAWPGANMAGEAWSRAL